MYLNLVFRNNIYSFISKKIIKFIKATNKINIFVPISLNSYTKYNYSHDILTTYINYIYIVYILKLNKDKKKTS